MSIERKTATAATTAAVANAQKGKKESDCEKNVIVNEYCILCLNEVEMIT